MDCQCFGDSNGVSICNECFYDCINEQEEDKWFGLIVGRVISIDNDNQFLDVYSYLDNTLKE